MDACIAPSPRARTWSSPKIQLRPGPEGLGVFAVELTELRAARLINDAQALHAVGREVVHKT